jgi:hypothetical protein
MLIIQHWIALNNTPCCCILTQEECISGNVFIIVRKESIYVSLRMGYLYNA